MNRNLDITFPSVAAASRRCGWRLFALVILVRMRMEEEGLSASDGCVAVLRDNLFGLELDPRCTQIAAFKTQHVSLKSGPLRTEAEVKARLAEQERTLVGKLKEGPVVIR